MVTSIDGDRATFSMLYAPNSPFVATVVQNAQLIGQLAGQAALDGRSGKPVPPSIFTTAWVATRNDGIAAAEKRYDPGIWAEIKLDRAEAESRWPQNQDVVVVQPVNPSTARLREHPMSRPDATRPDPTRPAAGTWRCCEGPLSDFGDVTVLHGVDLTLRAGEVHALVGQNGAGKSTLVKALIGVNRHRGDWRSTLSCRIHRPAGRTPRWLGDRLPGPATGGASDGDRRQPSEYPKRSRYSI
jgi:hypothetical protein